MRNRQVKRAVRVGHRTTSVAMEDEFWSGLREMARSQGKQMQELLWDISEEAKGGNFSAAIRLTVFRHFYNLSRSKD